MNTVHFPDTHSLPAPLLDLACTRKNLLDKERFRPTLMDVAEADIHLMGLEAATKWPKEGLKRPMPDTANKINKIRMDEEIDRRVKNNREACGFNR
jgi:hypothetical protein